MVKQKGFTLVELMIVVAILGVLVAIAIPSYNSYRVKVNRGDVKTEMMKIAQDLQRYQVANKTFKNVTLTKIGAKTNYPSAQEHFYTIALTVKNDGKEWELTALPTATGQQKDNGIVCLDNKGQKYWEKGQKACRLSPTSTWDD